MMSSVRDSELSVISEMAVRFGGHVAHGSSDNVNTIVAEFDRASFAFRQPTADGQEYRVDWYAGVTPLNREVFDTVNGDRDRHGVIVAGDFDTLRQRLSVVFEAVRNGGAFVH